MRERRKCGGTPGRSWSSALSEKTEGLGRVLRQLAQQGGVVLISFDHQRPVALRHRLNPDLPRAAHIHTVVRTPNGNDYGKDLLRQHYLQHPHPR